MAPTNAPPTPLPGSHWVELLDHDLLRRLVGRRALDLALASDLPYLRPPALADAVTVTAVLGDGAVEDWPGARPGPFRVELRVEDGTAGSSSASAPDARRPSDPACTWRPSRSISAFSQELREALLAGASTEGAASRAPAVRFAVDAELRFEGALEAWLTPTADGMRVEIAASPFAEVDPYVGHAYGDRRDRGARADPSRSSFVARESESSSRPREIVPHAQLRARAIGGCSSTPATAARPGRQSTRWASRRRSPSRRCAPTAVSSPTATRVSSTFAPRP